MDGSKMGGSRMYIPWYTNKQGGTHDPTSCTEKDTEAGWAEIYNLGN